MIGRMNTSDIVGIITVSVIVVFAVQMAILGLRKYHVTYFNEETGRMEVTSRGVFFIIFNEVYYFEGREKFRDKNHHSIGSGSFFNKHEKLQAAKDAYEFRKNLSKKPI